MKTIALLLLIVGVVMIIMGHNNRLNTCPPKKIEYRFIPRSFYDEQNATTNLKSLYNDMFHNNSAWMNYPLSQVDYNLPEKYDVNNFMNKHYVD